MNIRWPAPGRYILAVSGGADSMVLLDLMAGAARDRGYELVVAHFDHGLRAGSAEDRRFVQGAAKRYNLPVEHCAAQMGQGSEAAARAARHAWLEQVRVQHSATAVVTAHHQDDLLETSLLNLARGTGRRGLAPMQGRRILRPMLGATRGQLRDYATQHKVAWREDPTNADIANPRNFLRHRLLPHAPSAWRSRYLVLVTQLANLNTLIVQSISTMLEAAADGPSRYSFPRPLVRDLSLSELEELLIAAALNLRPGAELDRRAVQELALFARTAPPHRHRPLREGLELTIHSGFVCLEAT